VSSAIVLTALASLVALLLFSPVVSGLAPVALVGLVLAVVASRSLLSWQSLLTLILLVMLFIPIRRYTMPGGLPFELEPYRALVALVLSGGSGRCSSTLAFASGEPGSTPPLR
jgi:hypothetical protein